MCSKYGCCNGDTEVEKTMTPSLVDDLLSRPSRKSTDTLSESFKGVDFLENFQALQFLGPTCRDPLSSRR